MQLDDARQLKTDYVFYPKREELQEDGSVVIAYGDMMGKTESESVLLQQKLRNWAIYSRYMMLVHLGEQNLADFVLGKKEVVPHGA